MNSAILFQNEDKTVFLIDIPTSITLAQELNLNPSKPEHENQSPTQTLIPAQERGTNIRRRYPISAPPRQTPYPSTEPKAESARARVLEAIPVSERRFHGEFIQPLVRSALEHIRVDAHYEGRQWCLPRRVSDAAPDNKRKRELSRRRTTSAEDTASHNIPTENNASDPSWPPVILSSSSTNAFNWLSDLEGVVTNPSSETAILAIGPSKDNKVLNDPSEYIIPPQSTFVHCTLPLTEPSLKDPIPGVPPSQKFNLILFDPPWPNRSVRRGSHYDIHPYAEMELLADRLRHILRVHAYSQNAHAQPAGSSERISVREERQNHSQISLAAIWITNSEKARRTAYEALRTSGFRICEEWIWVKITADGRPISPLDGLWRRPYEILVIGRKETSLLVSDRLRGQEIDLLSIDPSCIARRVLAAVPDLHSRKPNLRAVFEEVFFRASSCEQAVEPYSALEVFARNLTAGWWACGNEVLKFNARECWTEEEEEES